MNLSLNERLDGLKFVGISRTSPTCDVVVDSTAVDTGHRDRGIGRYTAGLVGGIARAVERGVLDRDIALLRLRQGFTPPRKDGNTHAGRLRDAEALQTWTLHRPRVSHLKRWMLNEALLGAELGASCRVYHSTEPWAIPRSRNFRTVVTCHDLIPLRFPAHYMNRKHASWRTYFTWVRATGIYRRFDRVIAISEATKRDLVELLGVPEERIRVVYNGVDHDQFTPIESDAARTEARHRLGLPDRFVLYLGGYDHRKNIEALVASFGLLASRDAHLVLAGGMTRHMRRDFEERARAAGVSGRVHIWGYVDDRDLPALYANAAAFVYPSLAEGFGLQVLEAMALGCPVITSNVSSLPEIAGEAGLLVDPEDPRAIAAALQRVLDDGRLADELRARGRARVAQFSWDRCAAETAAVYEELL